MIRALILSLLLIPIASAASYDVTGVDWGDVLNIRKGASAKSAILGAIPYDGRGIDVAGTPMKGWVRVDYRGVKGFVLAKYLAPTEADGPLPAKLSCHGTEPFWTIEIAPGSTTYQHMTDPKEPLKVGPFMPAANRSNLWMATGNQTAISITKGAACSNGMSDDKFPYTVMSTTPGGDGVISGCCKARP